MAELSVIESIRTTLWEEMKRDPSVIVLGEDIGQRGGVFLATQGFLEEFGATRVIDTPLAEASIMGVALGASFNGLRPIPEVQFSDFIWPGLNQIIGEASKTSYGSNGQLNAPMVIRIPYGGGIRGGLYHSQNVESYFFHTPGLKICAPSTPYDAKGLLKSAIREVPDQDYSIPIGKADIKRSGQDITVISYGLMLHYCLEAAKLLEDKKVDSEIIDLMSLRPLDIPTIVESVKKTGKLIIVHEDNITGGVGAEIAAMVSDLAFDYLDGPIKRICGPDIPTMPFAKSLEDAYLPNTQSIYDGILELSQY